MIDCKYEIFVRIGDTEHRALHTHKSEGMKMAKALRALGADGVLLTDVYGEREFFRHGEISS